MKHQGIRQRSLVAAMAAAVGTFGWIAGAQAATDGAFMDQGQIVVAGSEGEEDRVGSDNSGIDMGADQQSENMDDMDHDDGTMGYDDSGSEDMSGDWDQDDGQGMDMNMDESEPEEVTEDAPKGDLETGDEPAADQ